AERFRNPGQRGAECSASQCRVAEGADIQQCCCDNGWYENRKQDGRPEKRVSSIHEAHPCYGGQTASPTRLAFISLEAMVIPYVLRERTMLQILSGTGIHIFPG